MSDSTQPQSQYLHQAHEHDAPAKQQADPGGYDR